MPPLVPADPDSAGAHLATDADRRADRQGHSSGHESGDESGEAHRDGIERRERSRGWASRRALWLRARTRNAARHRLTIAVIGVLTMLVCLVLYALVPRRIDHALTTQLSALPALRDTVPLLQGRDSAIAMQARAAAALASAAITTRASTAPAPGLDTMLDTALDTATASAAPVGAVPEGFVGVNPVRLTRPVMARRTPRDRAEADSLNAELPKLRQQLAQIRQAPLVEGYRALAESRSLRGDERTVPIMDSIEQVHREREAYATLGGPDSPYAALTARLTRLGERLVGIAESAEMRMAQSLAQSVAQRLAPLRVTPESESFATEAVPLRAPGILTDTLLQQLRRNAEAARARADSLLDAARAFNDRLQQQHDAIRARLVINVPPLAMLGVSVVFGLVVALLTVLLRELRRPTAGDAQELAALTRSRVIVHTRSLVRQMPTRRRSDALIPAILQQHRDDAWSLLHLTLTGIGDTSRSVQVMADEPALAGAVALNLAGVSARESRATVLVDAVRGASALVSLLPADVITSTTEKRAPRSGGTPLERTVEPDRSSRWERPRFITVGRDATVDLLLPRRVGYRDGAVDAGANTAGIVDAHVQRLLARYDLAVFVTDRDLSGELPANSDLILCARLGATPLAWLTEATHTARQQQRRIRAVVLWSAEAPV